MPRLNLPPFSFFSQNTGNALGSDSNDPLASSSMPAMPQVLDLPGGIGLQDPGLASPIEPAAAPTLGVAPLAMPFLPADHTAGDQSMQQPVAPTSTINSDQVLAPVLLASTPAPAAEPKPLELVLPEQPAKTEQIPALDAAPPLVTEPTPSPENSSSAIKALGINGFGRIGRTAFRVWWQRFRDQVPLKVINTSGSSDLATWAHLLKYDSNYGVLPIEITVQEKQTKDKVTDEDPELGTLTIEGVTFVVLAQRDPAKIPWAKYGVTTVIESTGKFVTQESAGAHLQAGAQRVIVSAPPKSEGQAGGMDMTVLGVQETLPTGQILSNASCTTNCVGPVSSIMQSSFGVEKALLNTIHAYTDDQNLHDNSHKDLRRARAAAQNVVPTSTGAARAVGGVIPELSGKFDGFAVRVPVAVGSLSDMVFVTSRDVTVDEVNQAFQTAVGQPRWQGILAVTSDPIVSRDIIGRSESAIVDLGLTQVVGGNLVRVVAWYDNEFGYCNRLVEVACA